MSVCAMSWPSPRQESKDGYLPPSSKAYKWPLNAVSAWSRYFKSELMFRFNVPLSLPVCCDRLKS